MDLIRGPSSVASSATTSCRTAFVSSVGFSKTFRSRKMQMNKEPLSSNWIYCFYGCSQFSVKLMTGGSVSQVVVDISLPFPQIVGSNPVRYNRIFPSIVIYHKDESRKEEFLAGKWTQESCEGSVKEASVHRCLINTSLIKILENVTGVR